jgi:hypothetical protein
MRFLNGPWGRIDFLKEIGKLRRRFSNECEGFLLLLVNEYSIR